MNLVDEKKKKVLILEDEPDAGLLLSSILQSHDYSHVLVTTVADAQRILAHDKKFDLLFLDYSLPDGNSLDLVRNKELVNEIPTILCSAYLSEDKRKTAKELGVLHCMSKPVNNEEIKNVLLDNQLVTH